jgi:hypothetical protein
MARTTFSGPVKSDNGFEGNITGNITGNVTGNLTGDVTGNVTGNVTGVIQLTTSTVAGLPTASTNVRKLYYVSNAAGGPTIVFSNGTNWIDVLTGTTVTT